MANKERYTVAQVIEALRKTRGMKGPAATLLRCHRDTITGYEKRHPTVAAAIAEERESMTDTAELSLARAITQGEAWAVCFYLKTQGKERGYVERVEQNIGGTVTHEHKHRYEDREQHFERLFAALDAERARADGDSRAGREALSVDTNGAGAKAT